MRLPLLLTVAMGVLQSSPVTLTEDAGQDAGDVTVEAPHELTGTWLLESTTCNGFGRLVEIKGDGRERWVFGPDGGLTVVVAGPLGRAATTSCEFDVSAQPKAIDSFSPDGSLRLPGIYLRQGGRLTICTSGQYAPEGRRPAKFEVVENEWLYVFRRVPDDP